MDVILLERGRAFTKKKNYIEGSSGGLKFLDTDLTGKAAGTT